jgi:hypothetical protein
MTFVVALALAAFLLALWLDTRFAERRPASATWRIGNAFAAGIVLQVAAFGSDALMSDGAGAATQLTAVFAILLPALVYAFLGGVWLVRTFADLAVARR